MDPEEDPDPFTTYLNSCYKPSCARARRKRVTARGRGSDDNKLLGDAHSSGSLIQDLVNAVKDSYPRGYTVYMKHVLLGMCVNETITHGQMPSPGCAIVQAHFRDSFTARFADLPSGKRVPFTKNTAYLERFVWGTVVWVKFIS